MECYEGTERDIKEIKYYHNFIQEIPSPLSVRE